MDRKKQSLIEISIPIGCKELKFDLFMNFLSQEVLVVKFHDDFHFVLKDCKNQNKLSDNNIPIFSAEFISTLLLLIF